MVDSPGRIPEEFIQTLLSRVDIVEVIGELIPLRKSGANHMACCPFHNEKTPSFSVNHVKQFYHCFGCGVSGDAIQFLIEQKGIIFVEAIELLAEQVGMPMPVTEKGPNYELHNLIYTTLSEASSFYEHQLRQQIAHKAVQYLKDRGLTGKVAKSFNLGFAPPGWDNLLSDIAADATKRDTGVAAGLFVNRETNKFYDRFRNRIIFPIKNRRGRVIGFGGRIVGEAKDEPKYLNSPETPVFNKGYELYGLYEARKSIASLDSVLVVEGYMDVISLAQSGLDNSVATLGTACTPHHVNTLFKLAQEVVFCFDGDRAGRKAAWRALETCLPILDDKHRVKFLMLGNDEDPDSYVREHGLAGMRAAIAKSTSLPDYLFATYTRGVDLEQIDGRVQVANEIKQHLVKLPESILKTMLFDRLGALINIDPAKLHDEVTQPEHRLSKFSQTIVRKSRAQNIKSLVLVSPAMRALALLLTHRGLLQELPSIDGIEKIDIAGCKLLSAVVRVLKENPQASDDEIKQGLPVNLAQYFVPAQLRGIAQIVPVDGEIKEFGGALELLRKREQEIAMDVLLQKSKVGTLTDADKQRMLQMLQEKGGISE